MRFFGRNVVLCFHSIGSSGLSRERFCSLINALVEIGYSFPSPELVNEIKGRKNAIISFDDGYYDNLEITHSYLSKIDIKPIIFVVTELLNDNIDNNEIVGLKNIRHFTFEDAKRYKDIVHFAYHTSNHDDLSYLDMDEKSIEKFIQGHNDYLELASSESHLFAYPFGYLPKNKTKFESLLESLSYKAAFTTKWGRLNSNENFYINRVVIGDNDSQLKAILKISGIFDWYARIKWRGSKYE
ncbi:polysaccharide deacetylase family protein [Vibrio cyclitrophicus]